jgi:hypothetical protein
MGAPQGAVHLSYFLRDRLYPGIRHPNLSDGLVSRLLREDKKGGEGFYLCLSHLGIKDCQVRPFWGGRQSIRLSAGGGREKLNVISQNSFGFEGNKDPNDCNLLRYNKLRLIPDEDNLSGIFYLVVSLGDAALFSLTPFDPDLLTH